MGLNDTGTILWTAIVSSSQSVGCRDKLGDYCREQVAQGRKVLSVDCPEMDTAVVLVAWQSATFDEFLKVEADRDRYGSLRQLVFCPGTDLTQVTLREALELMRRPAHHEKPLAFPRRATVRFD